MLTTSPARALRNLDKKMLDPRWLAPVLDDLSYGFLLEHDEQITYINDSYAAFLGKRRGDVLFSHVSSIPAAGDASRLLDFSRRRSNHEPAPRDYDFLAARQDGSVVRLQASVTTSNVEGRVLIAAVARPLNSSSAVAGGPGEIVRDARLDRLSPREQEVMEMILAGTRIKEIAFTLTISPKTVATIRTRMLRKLDLADNHSLFQYALRHHLVDWA